MPEHSHQVYIESERKDAYEQLITQAGLPDLVLTQDKSQATILLADPPKVANQLDAFPQLQWLQSTFAGVDTLVQPHLRQDYQLTNVKGMFGQLISEYVIGYTLSYFRHFDAYAQQQSQKIWQPIPYQTVHGKKMVILGTGSIGRHLADCAHKLGFHVIGMNRSGHVETLHQFSQIIMHDDLADAFEQADVIVNTLPKTKETIHFLDESTLNHCNGTLLFNVGRGDTIDTKALLDALDSGKIAHAFLDVFKQEPISQSCPYWLHEKITVTPHIAASSFPEDVFEVFAQNYRQWHQAQPLGCFVDFEKGY